jgi:hypothetical protein
MYGPQELSWHILRKVINTTDWYILGEVNSLHAFERKKEKKSYTFSFQLISFLHLDNFNANGYIVLILFAVYISLASILLIGLLIAMFRY